MATFTTSRTSTATLDASREATWAALVDPSLIAEFTPFVRGIDDLGDGRWRWSLARIPYPRGEFAAEFTERMTFAERERIDFRHEPPAGSHELAGADGTYLLGDRPDGRPGTVVSIDLRISATLPGVPAWGRRAVVTAMDVVIGRMGDTFAERMIAHLGRT